MARNAGLKLSTRLMFLVALPLSFELVLLAGIGLVQYQTEIFAHRLENARFVSSEYNSMLISLSRGAMAGIEADLDSNFNFPATALSIHQETRARLAKLEKVLEPNSPDFEALEQIKKLQSVAMDSLMSYEKSQSLESRVGRERPVMLINFVFSEFEKLSEIAAARAAQEQKRWEQWRDFELKALIGGIILSIIASAALARDVHKKVISRLNVVMKNIDHLAAHEALEPTLVGVDEIQRLDQMLRETAEKQEEAAQLKRELVDTVTHDLRAPLTSQTMFLDLVSDGHFDDEQEPMKKQARMLALDIKRLVGLLNNLLDAERMDAKQLEVQCKPTSIIECAEAAVSSLQGLLLSAKMDVAINMTEQEVFGDRLRLSQILTNLISNAINYAPTGSTVLILGELRGDMYCVRVLDRGPGVPADKVPLLFQRFRQVSDESARVAGSSGLGLAISKNLVEAQKGEIGYESAETGGACFWFTIPIPTSEHR